MSNGFIVRQIPVATFLYGATVNHSGTVGTDAAFPPGNVFDPQPKVIAKSLAAGAAGTLQLAVAVDLGVDTPVDTFMAMFTNLNATGSMIVDAATAAAGSGNFTTIANASIVAPTVPGGRQHVMAMTTGTVARYLRIYLSETAASAADVISCGVLFFGKRWLCELPYANFELGSGRKVIDLSDKRQLPGGEVGRWPKAKVPAFRATWSNMTDADLRSLWSILSTVGLSEPLVLVEDPDATVGLNERIHYCTIDALDYYERAQVDKSKIELKVTEWL